MAKISAQGKEIGTVYMTTSAKRYMSDGVVLKNIGFGWKIGGKCKTGVDPADVYARHAAHRVAVRAANPCHAAYVAELHALAGLSKRWKLHGAIPMMPDDPDGVWSEACDGYGDNVHADIDEIVRLCMLYRNAEAEARERKAA
jgi:hypothetical protein